jgi:hypothetical protein
VIKDSLVDIFKIRLMKAFLGCEFESCETTYVITKNKKIVAKVFENIMESKLKVICNNEYSWDTQDDVTLYSESIDSDDLFASHNSLHTVSTMRHKNHTQTDYRYETYSDLLHVLCAEKSDVDTYITPHNVYLGHHVHHTSDLQRSSCPL